MLFLDIRVRRLFWIEQKLYFRTKYSKKPTIRLLIILQSSLLFVIVKDMRLSRRRRKYSVSKWS